MLPPPGNMHHCPSISSNVYFFILIHKACVCFFAWGLVHKHHQNIAASGKWNTTESSLVERVLGEFPWLNYSRHNHLLMFMNSSCYFIVCVCFSCDSGGDCECLCTAIAAYAEECNRRGVYIRWRSQELCRMSKSHDAHTHPHWHSHTPVRVSFCNFCFLSCPCCLSLFVLCFPHSLQLCSVRMGWCMIPVVQLALPHVLVLSRVCTPSVGLSPVWRAASVLLAWSYMVRWICQTSAEPPEWHVRCKF